MTHEGKYYCSLVDTDYITTSDSLGIDFIEISWKTRNKNDNGIILCKDDAINFANSILEKLKESDGLE